MSNPREPTPAQVRRRVCAVCDDLNGIADIIIELGPHARDQKAALQVARKVVDLAIDLLHRDAFGYLFREPRRRGRR